MIPPIRRLVLLVLLFLLPTQAGAMEFRRDRVVIDTVSGARHSFDVELAETEEQRAQGLMFRQEMADTAGMLFLFDGPQTLSFWMKNTLIPLDIVFIRQDGTILNIVTAKPLDLTPVVSRGRGTGVLEINGGLAARLGIKAGDRVLHSHFGAGTR